MSSCGVPVLSIIIPFFNEETNVASTIEHVISVLGELSLSFELLCVDDGSNDHTWARLKSVMKQCESVKGIRLSRNFGKEAAVAAGLTFAMGRAVIIMDGDLQHPPKLIVDMVKIWSSGAAEVINAVKESGERNSWIKEWGARIFYGMQKSVCGMELENASDFKLLDHKVVEAWREIGERTLFFRGICSWLGFRQVEILFRVEDRNKGQSKWGISQLLNLGITGIISHTEKPLYLPWFLAFLFAVFGVGLGCQTLFMKFSGLAVSGFTTVILLILIIGTILLLSLGVMGLYLAQIVNEVKGRPRFVIQERTWQNNTKSENINE